MGWRHESVLSMKTNRQVNALSRLKNITNNRYKMLMHKTYILSNFSYCSTIWHHCSKYAKIKMEKLNKRALRIVYHNNKDMNYNNLLCISNNECLLSTVFKCIHGIVRSYLTDMLRDCSISTRNKYGIIQPRVRTTRYGLNSVRYDGARLWNKSENKLKVDDIKEFKQLLK